MLDLQRFESLLEDLHGSIEELPTSSSSKSHLLTVYDGLYSIFEEVLAGDVDFDKILREHEFLMDFLSEHMSYSDKLYIRIRENIYIK